MLPSPRDLECFMEAALKGSFTKAAQAMGLAQPSLSLAIGRLEKDVGFRLFVRHKTGVTLTPSGRQILAHAQELRQHWETMKSGAQSAASECRGSFVIGCHPSVALYSLPQALPCVLERYPELHLSFVHDLSRHINEGVAASRIDVGVVINPKRHPDLHIQHLGRDRVTLWSSEKDPVATRDLERATLYMHPDLAQTQQILRQLSKKRLAPCRVVESTSLELMARMVEQGHGGVAILPTRVALAASQKLHEVKGSPSVEDSIACVIHSAKRNIMGIRVLVAAMKESLGP
jgi:DNA-binding transcriptional LysR family regulator